MLRTFTFTLFALSLLTPLAKADDWPQWMGPNRDAVWTEAGVIKTLPKNDPRIDPKTGALKSEWRVHIHPGYSGPAVADGRVYVADRVLAKGEKNPDDPFDIKDKVNSSERVLCL